MRQHIEIIYLLYMRVGVYSCKRACMCMYVYAVGENETQRGRRREGEREMERKREKGRVRRRVVEETSVTHEARSLVPRLK